MPGAQSSGLSNRSCTGCPLVDRQGDNRSDRAIITPAPHRTLILVKVPWEIKRAATADGPSNLFAALFVEAAACAFRFLRQPSRPNAPRCRFRPEASPAEGCLAKRRHVSIAGDTAARSPAGMTHSVKALISAGRWIVGMEPRCAARSAQFIFRRRRCADAAFRRRRCPAADFRRRRCLDTAA